MLFSVSVNAEELLQKGSQYYKAENYEEALEIFKELCEKEPSTIANFYLGLTYKQIGDYRSAKVYLKEALIGKPRINDAYIEIVEILYHLNEIDEAIKLLDEAETQQIIPPKIAYLKGLLLFKEGRSDKAREYFKKAKTLDQNFTQLADFQIALTYINEKKMKEAKKSLEALIQIAPHTDIAEFAKEYLISIERLVKEWRINLIAGYLYDDNVVSKPSNIIGIPAVDAISGKRDSAAISDFKITYTFQRDNYLFFSANYGVYYKKYFRTKEYDMLINALEFTPGLNFKNATITLPLGYNHVWFNEKEYSSIFYFKPSFYYQFLPGQIAQISLGYAKRDMLRYIIVFNPDEDRDSNQYQIGAGYIYPFKDGRGLFYTKYEYIYDYTEGKNWESTSHRIFTNLIYPVLEKLSLNLTSDYTRQNYRNIHTLSGKGINGFPDQPEKRKESIWNISAGMIYKLTTFFNLNIRYTHTKNDSNFPIYDYKRNLYSLDFSFQF